MIDKILPYLKTIFVYDNEAPLLFTRFYFWAFFFVVLLIYSIIYKKRVVRNAFLFCVSLFFYYKSSGFFFAILIFSTMSDYVIGIGIHESKRRFTKTALLVISITINLFLLSYFKYAYFFTENFNEVFGTQFQVINHFAWIWNEATGSYFQVDAILLPVGISFFTFQTISYAVDVYQNKIKPVTNILDFGFYVSFFPQLVAGPIVRASEFIPQLYQPYSISRQDFGVATFWILKGLVKKLIIADYIAVNFVDRVFADPMMYDGFGNLMGLTGYSLQVYADFAGYTDIAIGVALLMGFRLPRNFNAPYKSRSVGEFWKRWHISLSTWLKDYLYIPLGGSRNASILTYAFVPICGLIAAWYYGHFYSIEYAYYIFGGTALLSFFYIILARFFPGIKVTWATNINLMITMLLGGLWHGASWQFVIWGGLNGIGLVVYKFWRKISPWEKRKGWVINAWKIFITFSFITFTRIWFRSESMEIADNMLNQIVFAIDPSVILNVLEGYWNVFTVMLFGFIIHWLGDPTKDAIRDFWVRLPMAVKIPVAAITVFICYQFVSSDLQAFIYFQF